MAKNLINDLGELKGMTIPSSTAMETAVSFR